MNDIRTSPEVALLGEDDVAAVVTPQDAMREMRAVFESMARQETRNFPVVRERLRGEDSVFGVKSAYDATRGILGLKAGGYFPLPGEGGGHRSSIVLFDAQSGALRAVVSGNLVTRLRTAAAAALSIELLARADARTLAVIGAGAQAEAHVRAALLVRPFSRVLAWSRTAPRAAALAARLSNLDCTVEVASHARDAVSVADVVITLTPSTQPVVEDAWVRAGTHLACMGADTAGKQELEMSILQRAAIYTDSPEQAISIGECQSAARSTQGPPLTILGTLGDILIGRVHARIANEITVYDGTGVAAQDLAMASLVLERRPRGDIVTPAPTRAGQVQSSTGETS